MFRKIKKFIEDVYESGKKPVSFNVIMIMILFNHLWNNFWHMYFSHK